MYKSLVRCRHKHTFWMRPYSNTALICRLAKLMHILSQGRRMKSQTLCISGHKQANGMQARSGCWTLGRLNDTRSSTCRPAIQELSKTSYAPLAAVNKMMQMSRAGQYGYLLVFLFQMGSSAKLPVTLPKIPCLV